MTDYKYPEFDKEGKIVCQICGKSFNIISASHLKKHDLTNKEYHDQFKDLKLTGDKYRTVQKFCHTSVFAPTPKALTEIMDEVVVDEPIEPIEDPKTPELTDEVLTLLNTKNKHIVGKPKVQNVMQNMKQRILQIFQRYLFHIQTNYTVQIFTPSGHLLHEVITDFADPIQKIVINFPKAFWHNRNRDPLSTKHLTENEWIVIENNSLSPSNAELIDMIQPILNKTNLVCKKY